MNSRPRRKFNELHVPMSQLFEKLKLERYLGPLDPWPPSSPMPKGYKSHEFWKYQQEPSRQIDKCINLRYAIQNLIDKQVITLPSSARRSNFAWIPFYKIFLDWLFDLIVYFGFAFYLVFRSIKLMLCLMHYVCHVVHMYIKKKIIIIN